MTTTIATIISTITAAGLGLTVGFLLQGWALGLVCAGIACINALLSGARRVYDWASPKGWLAFVLDSTWGLLGTGLGLLVHLVNLVWPGSNFRADLSAGKNRHIYEQGVFLKADYAFTLGNAISNSAGEAARIEDQTGRLEFLEEHEDLHVWQNRIFGPVMQITYVLWALGGFVVATIVWFFHTNESYGGLIQTTCYYDNPFEYWAYTNNDYWPPDGSHPLVRWGGAATT